MIWCLYVFLLVVISCGFSNCNLQTDIISCKPQQVHLSYGESVSEMIIMWSTDGPCSTLVKYGVDLFNLNLSGTGSSHVFSEPWNKLATNNIHRIKLIGLTAGTLYYYQPISNDVSVGPFYFKTPLSTTNNDEAGMQLLTLGDLSSSSSVFPKLQDETKGGKYTGIIQPGNMALNLSKDGGKNGDLFMSLMEPIVKTVPYMTAPGPAESDNGTFSQYQHRFSMPFTEWPMTSRMMWYSLDLGLVHLVSYSTEVLYTNKGQYSSLQHDWLLKDLKVANENRDRTPWIIAFGHRPMYCTNEDPAFHCNKKKSKVATELEDIMFHYGVDLIISSNGQGYEISYPMYKGVKVSDNYDNPQAPVHVTLGSASPWSTQYNYTKDGWLNILDESPSPLSFGRIQVLNSTLLRYQMVSFNSFEVLDSFEITNHKHKQFSKDDLPANITAMIDERIRESGGEPDDMNVDEEANVPSSLETITKKIHEIFVEGKNHNKVILGTSIAGGLLLVVVIGLIVRRVCRGRRRRESTRRWENMDINYGKRYYNKAPDKDDTDNENDFEIDMTETSAPSKKLLSDD